MREGQTNNKHSLAGRVYINPPWRLLTFPAPMIPHQVTAGHMSDRSFDEPNPTICLGSEWGDEKKKIHLLREALVNMYSK